MLSFLGDIDLIVERIHNPGWMGDIYNQFLSFSPKFNMALFLLASASLAYLFFTKRNTAISTNRTEHSSGIEVDIGSPTQNHPLVVEFDGIPRTKYQFPVPASYAATGRPVEREYYFSLFNQSKETIRNVRICIESISECPPSGKLMGDRGSKVAFEDGNLTMTFPAQHREPIPFLLFTYNEKNDEKSNLQMTVKTNEPHVFDFHGRPHELVLKITSEEMPPLMALFFIEIYRGKINVEYRDYDATRS